VQGQKGQQQGQIVQQAGQQQVPQVRGAVLQNKVSCGSKAHHPAEQDIWHCVWCADVASAVLL
jgi:hypothetical protein